MKLGLESVQEAPQQEVPKEVAALSPEQIEHNNHELEVYDALQREVILRFMSNTPAAEVGDEFIMNWIEKYSKKFSEVVARGGELLGRFIRTTEGTPEHEALLKEVESKLYQD